jgi:hypothetical protein
MADLLEQCGRVYLNGVAKDLGLHYSKYKKKFDLIQAIRAKRKTLGDD